MQEPFDCDDDYIQPDEPDWEALLRALDEADEWLRSENGLDEKHFIMRITTVGLASTIIEGAKSGTESDDLIRRFFEAINMIAYWVAGNCSDEKLRQWVERFC